MDKLFWNCFCDTGKIDMYLFYKDYENGLEFEEQDTDILEQSPLENTQPGGTFE